MTARPTLAVVRSRQEERARKGRLTGRKVSAKSLGFYTTAVQYFIWWLTLIGLVAAATNAELDAQLCEYIEHLYEAGLGHNHAGYAISGAQHFLQTPRNTFTRAWQLLTIWKRDEAPRQAPPMSVQIAVAMVSAALFNGWVDMGGLLAVGFACLLRTTEMILLEVSAVEFTRGNKGVRVILESTKMTKRGRAAESVYTEDPLAVRMLSQAIEAATRAGRTSILQGNAFSFRTRFKKLLQQVGLPDAGYTPYSIRRGGATHLWQNTLCMDAVMEAGRWASLRTARVYVKAAEASMRAANLPEERSEVLVRWGLRLL